MAEFDRTIVDGGVNGAGWLTRLERHGVDVVGHLIVDGAVRFTSFFRQAALLPACLLESGRVQTYALFMLVGLLAFLGITSRGNLWTSTSSASFSSPRWPALAVLLFLPASNRGLIRIWANLTSLAAS